MGPPVNKISHYAHYLKVAKDLDACYQFGEGDESLVTSRLAAAKVEIFTPDTAYYLISRLAN